MKVRPITVMPMPAKQNRSVSDQPYGKTKIRLTLDGNSLDALKGDSIAAAMIAAGEHRFRDCKNGHPRGLFCGMGVCGECQVLVDGVSRRACLTKASEGQVIRRLPAKRALPVTTGRADVANWREEDVDVLVVGAGPAGLSAAIAAAQHDLDVLVIDERSQAGGQYFKQPAADYDLDASRLDAQFREGIRLIDAAIAAGVRAEIWQIEVPSPMRSVAAPHQAYRSIAPQVPAFDIWNILPPSGSA